MALVSTRGYSWSKPRCDRSSSSHFQVLYIDFIAAVIASAAHRCTAVGGLGVLVLLDLQVILRGGSTNRQRQIIADLQLVQIDIYLSAMVKAVFSVS